MALPNPITDPELLAELEGPTPQAPQPVSDPAILAELESGPGSPVEDPELLSQLEGAETPSVEVPATPMVDPRSAAREEFVSRMKEMRMFPNLTDALNSWVDNPLQKENGVWRTPMFGRTADENAGYLESLGSVASNVTQSLLGKFGKQSSALDTELKRLQVKHGLTDEDMTSMWSDLGNQYRQWEKDEPTRVLSDGRILLNPTSEDILDSDAINLQIDKSQASPERKAEAKANLRDVQVNAAGQRLESYEAMSSALSGRFGKLAMGPTWSVQVAGLKSPTEWAKETGRKVENTPDFIRDYENAVVKQKGAVGETLAGLAMDWMLGQNKLATTVLGIGGAAGSDTMAQKAMEGQEAAQMLGQDKPDTGLLGGVIQEIPSLSAQIVTGRLLGAAGALATQSAKGANIVANVGTVATAGAQSMGMQYADSRLAGKSHEEAQEDAVKAGVNTALITGVFQSIPGFGGVETVAAGKQAAGVTVRDLFKVQTGKELFDNTRKFVGRTLLAAGGEASEEGLDQITSAFLNADPDTNLSDAWDGAFKAAALGGLLGGGVDIVSGAVETPEIRQAQALVNQAKPEAPAAAAAAQQVVAMSKVVTPPTTTTEPVTETPFSVTEAAPPSEIDTGISDEQPQISPARELPTAPLPEGPPTPAAEAGVVEGAVSPEGETPVLIETPTPQSDEIQVAETGGLPSEQGQPVVSTAEGGVEEGVAPREGDGQEGQVVKTYPFSIVPPSELPAPQPKVVLTTEEQKKVDRFDELSYKETQSRLPKGVKLTAAEKKELAALAPQVRPLVMETVDPDNDPIVGADINDQPIRQSKVGTFYTIENGRIRTGAAFATPAPDWATQTVQPTTPNVQDTQGPTAETTQDETQAETPAGRESGGRGEEAPVEGEARAVTRESLKQAFDLTDTQAAVSEALAEALGVTGGMLVTRGGVPGSGAVMQGEQTTRLTEAQYARHAELEAKHNAGTITDAERQEAQELVDAAAQASGYPTETLYHTSSAQEPFTEFRYAALPGGEDRFKEGSAKRVLTFALEGLSPGWFTSNPAQFSAWKKPDESNVIRAKVNLRKPLRIDADPFARERFVNEQKELSDIREKIKSHQNGEEFIPQPEFRRLVEREKQLAMDVDFSRATEDEVLRLSEKLNETYTKKGILDLEKQIKNLVQKTGTPEQILRRRRELKYADPFYGLMSLAETAKQSYPDLVPGAALRAALMDEGYDGIILEGTNADTRLGDTTLATWVIPFEGGRQIKSADPFTGTPLSERFDPTSPDIRFQGPKGSTEIVEAGKVMVRGLNAPDFTTAAHEMIHAARMLGFPTLSPEQVTTLEEWAGAKDGKWSVRADEKLARGWERYLASGRAPLQRLQAAFDAMARWFRDVYGKISGSDIDVEISDAVRGVFDSIIERVGIDPMLQDELTKEVIERNLKDAAGPLVPPTENVPVPTATPEPDNAVTATHAYSDQRREELGLPPRFGINRITNAEAWDSAVAAEVEWKNAGKPGTAGAALLQHLMNNPDLNIDKNQQALLLHEVLVREDAVDEAQTALNSVPENASIIERDGAKKRSQDAMDSYNMLMDFLDRLGSRSGQQLQARQIRVNRDYSLAAIQRAMLNAKNLATDTPQQLTPKEQAQAAELAEKLKQAEARISLLGDENTELARIIETMTADVERAQRKTRDPKKKAAIRERLDPMVEAAKKRLADRGVVRFQQATRIDRRYSGVPVETLQDIKDLGIVTAGWLVDKALTLQEFTGKLVDSFGENVREHAAAIFGFANQVYRESEATVTGEEAPTPQTVIDAIDTTNELTREDVWAVARAFVISGVRGTNVLDETHKALAQEFEGLTRERVAELFTDYGIVAYPSPKEVPKELARVRSLEQLGLKILDLKEGRPPKRTGFQRGEKDVEVRELEKEFRKLLKETGIQATDPAYLRSALATAKRRMQNEIEEIQHAIDTNQKRVARDRAPIDFDEEAVALRSQLEAKRAEYESIFGEEITEEKRIANAIKALDRQIEEEDRMLADGVFARPQGRPVIETPEIAERRRILAEKRQLRRDLYEAENPGQTALEQAKRQSESAIKRLQDVLAGNAKKIDNRQTVDPDEELWASWYVREALRDEVAEMRRAQANSPERVARQIATALKASEKALERIQRKLDNNDLSVPPLASSPASKDAAVMAVRERVKELNRELQRRRNEAKPKMDPETARIHRWLAQAAKRKAELERRIREKDFSEKRKPEPINSPEVRRAKYEYEQLKAQYARATEEAFYRSASIPQRAGFIALGTANLVKILKLGGDLGAIFRNLGGLTAQGIYLEGKRIAQLANPRLSKEQRIELKRQGSILGEMLSSGAKVFVKPDTELEVFEKVMSRPGARYDDAGKIVFVPPFDTEILQKEDIPRARFIEQLPWWVWPAIAGGKWALMGLNLPTGLLTVAVGALTKPGLMAIDRAQRVMTNVARARFYDYALQNATPSGHVDAKDARAIGDAVMIASGRGVSRALDPAVPFLNLILLATRFYLSRIQSLILYPLWSKNAMKASVESRKEISRMYMRSIAGRAALYALFIAAFGKLTDDDKDDEEREGIFLNPLDPDFGRVRVKGVGVDFMSGINSFAHHLAVIAAGEKYDPKKEEYTILRGPLATQKDVGDEVINFWSNRRNLLTSYLWSITKGQFYGGKEVNPGTMLEEATTAIIINDTKKIFNRLGPVKGAAVWMMLFAGAGTQAPMTEEEKEIEKEKAAAAKDRAREARDQ